MLELLADIWTPLFSNKCRDRYLYNNEINVGTFGRHGPRYFLISCRDRYLYNNKINVGTFGRHGLHYFLISCRDRYLYNNEINVGTFARHRPHYFLISCRDLYFTLGWPSNWLQHMLLSVACTPGAKIEHGGCTSWHVKDIGVTLSPRQEVGKGVISLIQWSGTDCSCMEYKYFHVTCAVWIMTAIVAFFPFIKPYYWK